MKYLIGIDGGGTKSVCVVADLNDKVLIKKSTATSNYLLKGKEKTASVLLDLIQRSVKGIKGDLNDVAQIVIGVAGAGRAEHALKLEKTIKSLARRKKIMINSIGIVSDAVIALEGAFAGLPGCILIAGTGSIAFAKDKNNLIHRVGGFGRLIGDEGSGYSIGKKAVQVLSKQMDGRINETIFKKVLSKKLGISSEAQLIVKVYENKYQIASIVRDIFSLAERKDKTALSILNEETNELILHLKSIKKKLRIKNLQVAFIGSLIENNNVYSKLLRKKISSDLKGVRVVTPRYSPAEGAILLAKRLIND